MAPVRPAEVALCVVTGALNETGEGWFFGNSCLEDVSCDFVSCREAGLSVMSCSDRSRFILVLNDLQVSPT